MRSFFVFLLTGMVAATYAECYTQKLSYSVYKTCHYAAQNSQAKCSKITELVYGLYSSYCKTSLPTFFPAVCADACQDAKRNVDYSGHYKKQLEECIRKEGR